MNKKKAYDCEKKLMGQSSRRDALGFVEPELRPMRQRFVPWRAFVIMLSMHYAQQQLDRSGPDPCRACEAPPARREQTYIRTTWESVAKRFP
ncbi:hypothetical protein RB195_010532 [Necator americanus]